MITILTGDCRDILKTLPSESVHCCVTSPPYFGLRDYGVAGQIGLEPTPEAFVAEMVSVFREVRRVLRNDATCWLNLGDSYAGSWGAQSRGNTTGEAKSRLEGSSMLEARTIEAHVLGRTHTGSLKNTPGLKNKDLIGIPWMVAFALRADGWYLRQDLIWSKPNPMPESVQDRCTKAHEYMFLLSKSERYFYDADAICEPAQEWTGQAATFDRGDNAVASHILPGQSAAQHRPRPSVKRGGFNGKTEAMADSGQNAFRAVVPTRNRRSVWTVATRPFAEAHFATFPPALIDPCILAGCPAGGTVLDPFGGAGTTGLVADRLGRNATLIELNPEYATIARNRIHGDSPLFAEINHAAE